MSLASADLPSDPDALRFRPGLPERVGGDNRGIAGGKARHPAAHPQDREAEVPDRQAAANAVRPLLGAADPADRTARAAARGAGGERDRRRARRHHRAWPRRHHCAQLPPQEAGAGTLSRAPAARTRDDPGAKRARLRNIAYPRYPPRCRPAACYAKPGQSYSENREATRFGHRLYQTYLVDREAARERTSGGWREKFYRSDLGKSVCCPDKHCGIVGRIIYKAEYSEGGEQVVCSIIQIQRLGKRKRPGRDDVISELCADSAHGMRER